jgi:hypothetical protein
VVGKIPGKQLGNAGIWEKITKTIPASTTDVIDTITLTDFSAVKYIICIEMLTRVVMLDMNLIKDNSVIAETIFGKIGRGINFDINTNTGAGVMTVNVTNHELNSIYIEFVKYKFN